MGLFRKRAKGAIRIKTSITADVRAVEIPDDEWELISDGWKQDQKGEWQPPETVWITPQGDVYHRFYYCTRGAIRGGIMATESEAIELGYEKCPRCDWERPYQYL